ncbi:MAG: His/Gly/Thr/Pro-type tRNA ligase C-terminal domain-containing protein, partial [Eubacteriales bacterium]
KLRLYGIRVTVVDRSEKIGYKIREARNERIPYMLVAGDQEVLDGTFAVRKRGQGDIGSVGAEDFLQLVIRETNEKIIF